MKLSCVAILFSTDLSELDGRSEKPRTVLASEDCWETVLYLVCGPEREEKLKHGKCAEELLFVFSNCQLQCLLVKMISAEWAVAWCEDLLEQQSVAK